MNLDEVPPGGMRPWGRGDATGHPRQCTAHSASTGQPCRGFAIAGGTVCVFHGGSAPQVREAARRRIEGLVPDALRAIADLVTDTEAPHAVRLRAAQDVLDRAGTKAPEEIVVVPQEATNEALDAAIAAVLDDRRRDQDASTVIDTTAVLAPPAHDTAHT